MAAKTGGDKITSPSPASRASFAPFFVTWLIEATGSPIAPVFYVMFGAAISLVAAFFLADHAHEARLPIREAIAGQVKTA